MISPMGAGLPARGVVWAEMAERSPSRAAAMNAAARSLAVGRSPVLVETAVRTPWIWRRTHQGELASAERCQRR